MALTRTPEQMALTETSRLCQEIMDLSGDALEQTSDAELTEVLRRVVAEHARVKVLVDRRLHELDDLPLTPDPEWEALKKIAVRTKELFASDANLVLLDERIAHEEKLLAHLNDALADAIDAQTRTCLEHVERVASESKGALESARLRRVPRDT